MVKKRRQVSKKFIPQASIVSDELYIPNHSGEHQELIVNKEATFRDSVTIQAGVPTLIFDDTHMGHDKYRIRIDNDVLCFGAGSPVVDYFSIAANGANLVSVNNADFVVDQKVAIGSLGVIGGTSGKAIIHASETFDPFPIEDTPVMELTAIVDTTNVFPVPIAIKGITQIDAAGVSPFPKVFDAEIIQNSSTKLLVGQAYSAKFTINADKAGAGTLMGYFVDSPTYAGTKPDLVHGLFVSNLGSSGIINSYGMFINKQTASTNNYGLHFEGNGDVGAGIDFDGKHEIYSDGNELIVDTGTGSMALPKTAGQGIKVDTATPTFGFADLLGDQFSKNTGATKPTLTAYNGSINCWQFGAGDEAFITYHIPHDYVPGSEIFLHIHWSHIGDFVTGGNITFKATSIYSKGHNQAAFQTTPATGTFTGTASTTKYQHIISETSYSASSPTGIQLDTDLLEPDGVVELTFEMDANNITVSEGVVPDPFIHFVDIHYQTTGLIGTKDKAPDFYT